MRRVRERARDDGRMDRRRFALHPPSPSQSVHSVRPSPIRKRETQIGTGTRTLKCRSAAPAAAARAAAAAPPPARSANCQGEETAHARRADMQSTLTHERSACGWVGERKRERERAGRRVRVGVRRPPSRSVVRCLGL